MHISTNFLLLDARGTIIKIPQELAKKSPILNNYIENEWKDNNEPYYLNYSKETVHTFLDYLSGETITDYKCYRIYNELILKDEEKIIFDDKKIFMTLNDISEAINGIQHNFQGVFYNKKKNKIIIHEDDQVQFIIYLTWLSYSKGYHMYSHKIKDYNIGLTSNMSIKEINKHLDGAVFTYDKKYWFYYQESTETYKYDKYDTIFIQMHTCDSPIKRTKHIHEKK